MDESGLRGRRRRSGKTLVLEETVTTVTKTQWYSLGGLLPAL